MHFNLDWELIAVVGGSAIVIIICIVIICCCCRPCRCCPKKRRDYRHIGSSFTAYSEEQDSREIYTSNPNVETTNIYSTTQNYQPNSNSRPISSSPQRSTPRSELASRRELAPRLELASPPKLTPRPELASPPKATSGPQGTSRSQVTSPSESIPLNAIGVSPPTPKEVSLSTSSEQDPPRKSQSKRTVQAGKVNAKQLQEVETKKSELDSLLKRWEDRLGITPTKLNDTNPAPDLSRLEMQITACEAFIKSTFPCTLKQLLQTLLQVLGPSHFLAQVQCLYGLDQLGPITREYTIVQEFIGNLQEFLRRVSIAVETDSKTDLSALVEQLRELIETKRSTEKNLTSFEVTLGVAVASKRSNSGRRNDGEQEMNKKKAEVNRLKEEIEKLQQQKKRLDNQRQQLSEKQERLLQTRGAHIRLLQSRTDERIVRLVELQKQQCDQIVEHYEAKLLSNG